MYIYLVATMKTTDAAPCVNSKQYLIMNTSAILAFVKSPCLYNKHKDKSSHKKSC